MARSNKKAFMEALGACTQWLSDRPTQIKKIFTENATKGDRLTPSRGGPNDSKVPMYLECGTDKNVDGATHRTLLLKPNSSAKSSIMKELGAKTSSQTLARATMNLNEKPFTTEECQRAAQSIKAKFEESWYKINGYTAQETEYDIAEHGQQAAETVIQDSDKDGDVTSSNAKKKNKKKKSKAK